ncbi:RNase H domain-containing protein [Trichonephila clavipes]|nr:RNase H domain-containing protein [Trichonephila clavipes]
MLNEDEIVTSVQEESDPVDDETDEDEDKNNISSKGPSNQINSPSNAAFSALETAMQWYVKQSECCILSITAAQENQRPCSEKTKVYNGTAKNKLLFSTIKRKRNQYFSKDDQPAPQELCISKVDILQWIPSPPIYENRKINIYTHELPFQNKDLPDDIVQNMFNDYIQPKFNNNIIIATDGSKNTNQTSIGILIPKKKVRQNFILKEIISIFTAEAIAIWTALKNCVSETENYIILTDRLSVLKSIQNINRKSNTIILNLSSTLHQCLQIAQSITLIWVPAHKGIGINEEVDKLAKASPEPWNIISWITWEDLHTYFKKQHKNKSEEIWKKSKRHKNYFYTSHLEKWNRQAAKNRNTEILINKLRAKTLPLNDINFLFKQTDSPLCADCKVP